MGGERREGGKGGREEEKGKGGREDKRERRVKEREKEGKKRKGKEGGKTGWRGKDVVSLAMTQNYKVWYHIQTGWLVIISTLEDKVMHSAIGLSTIFHGLSSQRFPRNK